MLGLTLECSAGIIEVHGSAPNNHPTNRRYAYLLFFNTLHKMRALLTAYSVSRLQSSPSKKKTRVYFDVLDVCVYKPEKMKTLRG